MVMTAPASVPSASVRLSAAPAHLAAVEVIASGPPAAGGIASETSVSRPRAFEPIGEPAGEFVHVQAVGDEAGVDAPIRQRRPDHARLRASRAGSSR